MALSNNEKQIRHKELEELKKYGNEILVRWVFSNSGVNKTSDKTNEEAKKEIEALVNLPSGWTNNDYKNAKKKLNNFLNGTLENHNLMDNDINASTRIDNPDFNKNELKKSQYKAPEVVRIIKSTLKLSELSKSDQIAVVAEVLRQLAKELLDENKIPKTFANATALSLISHQYKKPEWFLNVLARNLYIQNSEECTKKLVEELQNPNIKNEGILL